MTAEAPVVDAVAPVAAVEETVPQETPTEPETAPVPEPGVADAPAAAPSFFATPVEVPLEAPAAAPVVEALPVVEEAVATLDEPLKDSGLILIETRRDAAAPVAPVEPAQPLGRRRRAVAPVAEEPLVQVETGAK